MVQQLVSKKRDVELEIEESNDNRSYHVNSEKIKNKLGFKPLKDIKQAISDLIEAFEKEKLPKSLEDEKYFNIKTMKSVNLK